MTSNNRQIVTQTNIAMYLFISDWISTKKKINNIQNLTFSFLEYSKQHEKNQSNNFSFLSFFFFFSVTKQRDSYIACNNNKKSVYRGTEADGVFGERRGQSTATVVRVTPRVA